MNNDGNTVGPVAESRERKMVFALSVVAAIHVFIFSAAFPLFDNADENMHFDLVVKYSQNGIPRTLDTLSDDTLNYIVLFSTAEYFEDPANFPGGKFPPPPWTQPLQKTLPALLAEKKMGSNQLSYESSEPPVYYELQAFWWRIGKWCGMHDGYLPYWLRFFNVLLVPGLVWIGYWTARLVVPDRLFVRLAVPALIAFLPQSIFYSITNDVLPPLSFGLAFVCLIYFWQADTPDVRLGALTGLALALSFLTKMTILPMLAVSAVFVLVKIRQLAIQGRLGRSLPALAALIFCAGLPAAVWMTWCKKYYGDFFGSWMKAKAFGYTIKPFYDWWNHPLFTPHGFWFFLSGNVSSFWQGEMKWHEKPLVLPGTPLFFTLISLILLAAALPALVSKSPASEPSRRPVFWLALACYCAGLLFSALLSIRYDFHDNYYPSRAIPFFVSGRFHLAVLIPVLSAMAFGLDRLLNRFGNRTKFLTLALMLSVMLILEIATDYPVFPNAYNWFHLL
jgi:hypothetical protein